MKWLIGIIIAIVIIGGGWYLWSNTNNQLMTSSTATTTPAQTYGMSEYSDPNGFTFWYPSSVSVTATSSNDTTSFPGGTVIERLQVGEPGGTYVAVVQSPGSTITDEPNNHASPISQTKYFFDASSSQWMVAYPEGASTGKSATTTADTSKTSIGGLTMLSSGARFDTTIIPLSKTLFLVIADGGGSSYTSQLAFTVAPTGATVDQSALSAALQAESNAFSSSQ